jgi:transposase-like protein
MSEQHHNKFHRKNFDQVCERCSSKNIRRMGFSKERKQRFECNNCKLYWTINKSNGFNYDQISPNCNSRYAKKIGYVNDRQRFQCKSCKKCWSIPLIHLVVKKPDNDSRYEKISEAAIITDE